MVNIFQPNPTQCNFRSFPSTSIDRGIGIDRFGVENPMFYFNWQINGAPAKNVRSPKTAMRQYQLANILRSVVNFDRFRALRSIEASASVGSASKKRRSILIENSTARQVIVIFDCFRAPRSIEASASTDSASKTRRSISVGK